MKNLTILSLMTFTLAVAASAFVASEARAGRGNGALGVVYVSSQDLYYDTFVTAEALPPSGPFQELEPSGSGFSVTEFGPGDPGYVGGRWKVSDGQGGYNYFLCPLLPPGRDQP